jgi:hypothetical protein
MIPDHETTYYTRGKTFSEGAPAEEVGILGWEFDLNSLLIKLPLD